MTIHTICKQRYVNHFPIALYGQVIHGRMTPVSDGTPRISAHTIFLADRMIGLHFATNDIGLSSLKFFW